MEKKVEIGQNAKVRIVWSVIPSDYSEEKVKNIKAAMANKYGIPVSNISVETNIISKNKAGELSLNKDTIQNIQDPKFQQELFKRYLAEKEITDYDFNEILKIDSQINALIDYDSYDKGRKYTLKWLDWDNFLSFGENNHIDFTDFSGLVLLNSVPANQGGKSTFAYDLLHFLFFGKTHSGKMETLGDLFNRHIPEATTLKVEGCLNIDGYDYIIRRTLTRPSLKSKSKTRTVTQKVEYFRVLGDGNYEELGDIESLEDENNVKTSKAIKEAIGNERDFDLVISANADNLKELISLKDTDRGRLLTRWIGLLPIEDKDIKAREKWNREINVNRYSNKYNRETLKAEITETEGFIKEAKEAIDKLNEKIAESNKKMEEYTKSRDALLSSKQKVDENLVKIDVATLERKIADITDNGKITAQKKSNEEAKLKELGEAIEFDAEGYKALNAEKDSLIADISKIKGDISNLKLINKQLQESEYCPTCKRKLDNVDNSATINENKEKIDKLIASGVKKNDRLTAVKAEIEKLDVIREKNTERNRVELLVSKFNVELEKLRAELIEARNTLKEINNNKAAIEANNKIDTSLSVLTVNINTEFGIINTSSNNIISLTKDIEAYEKGILDRKVIIEKINEEEKIEKHWKLYLAMIGKDGISKMVLREALPIINSELDRLLDDVCDFTVSVEMNDKNDVEFIMTCKSDGVRQKLSAGSGFEQTAASLALRVVLGNMSALSKPPFLLLDEVLGGVAKENYDNMKKLYDKIAQYFDILIQITHLDDIAHWHNRTITVVKNNGISKLDF